MSRSFVQLVCPGRSKIHLAVRQAGLLALLLAEVLTLTLRFDSQTLAGRGGGWGQFLGCLHFVPQALTVVAAATLLFWGPRIAPSSSE